MKKLPIKSSSEPYSNSMNFEKEDSEIKEDNRNNRMHPAHEEYNECRYVGDWGDCDPFKMIRIKEERLVLGGSECVEKRNITKPCSRNELPPGTMWLINEHKLCVMELEKLKNMIEDLHRYIDLIHQRGQSLFNAYNELRKRLMEIRREITMIGEHNHDAEQTINRLRKEVDNWKGKSNKMQMELNQLKAQLKGMEIQVRTSKINNDDLMKKKEELISDQARLNSQFDGLNTDNRNLKTELLDAERYKEELRGLLNIVSNLNAKIERTRSDISKTREDLRKSRIEAAMTRSKQSKQRTNKDTKVNLDMTMWITHNITKEPFYEPVLKYGENPKYENYQEKPYDDSGVDDRSNSKDSRITEGYDISGNEKTETNTYQIPNKKY